MTWRAGPPWVATRHRGHVAALGWPAQEAQGGQPSGREATQPRGRPCGVPRGDSAKEEIGQLIGEFTPLVIRASSFSFLRVGLCSHTVLPWRRRGRMASVGSPHGRLRSRGPESTRSAIQARAENTRVSSLI